ncbi:MAG TPA: CBS domain-containing protein [Candidatus Omnitrophota bacterium]|nr:CBS domain-containing protein [Candidatus Omnitrophota bacterium]
MANIESIMNRNVLTIRDDTPIYDAINLLVTCSISGLPVVDEYQKLVGIITEKDMIHISLGSPIDPKSPVSNFMSKQVATFSPQDEIKTVCEFLMANPFRRVPIVENGEVVGVISRRDILKYILKLHGKSVATNDSGGF